VSRLEIAMDEVRVVQRRERAGDVGENAREAPCA
jgi:hypothetical protein